MNSGEVDVQLDLARHYSSRVQEEKEKEKREELEVQDGKQRVPCSSSQSLSVASMNGAVSDQINLVRHLSDY